jgi:hypothetical protein
MDVHHRTLLTNPKQDADVARNIGRFTNYSLFFCKCLYRNNS